jgi:hypothetical protein
MASTPVCVKQTCVASLWRLVPARRKGKEKYRMPKLEIMPPPCMHGALGSGLCFVVGGYSVSDVKFGLLCIYFVGDDDFA